MAAAAALAALVVAGADATSPARAPSRLLVSGDEYSLVLSRLTLKQGPALIQFLNRGEDRHDLRLRRAGATRVVSAPEVGAGGLVELETRLRAGRYRLWCSLPGHRRLGMRAALKVRRGR